VNLTSINSDIQLYLIQRLTILAKQRSDLNLPNPWPSGDEIIALTRKSAGLFIFASTMVKFIEMTQMNVYNFLFLKQVAQHMKDMLAFTPCTPKSCCMPSLMSMSWGCLTI